MHETAEAFFHLDQSADQASRPAGQLRLQGWAVGKHDRPLADLRIRLVDKIYPVAYGFLRPDLADYFKFRTPHLLGGFEAIVSLPAGRHELAFEACTISGHWLPVGSITLNVAADHGPPPPAVLTAVMQPHEFARALQFTLRGVAQHSLVAATDAVMAGLPLPQVTRYPHLPFHGHLYEPALQERVLFGRMEIKGWLFHETVEIRQVTATVDLQAWQPLEHGGPLPHVAALFPQHPLARACQIGGWIDVPAQLPSPLSLRIYAELADGSWHLCHVQRTTVTDNEQEKAPFVRFSPLTFGRACLELRRAGRRAGRVVPVDRHLWRGIRGVYQEFRSRAPRHPAAAAPDAAPLRAAASPLPRSVALVTHNFGFEGAPLFLLEYARELHRQGVRLRVFSGAEGPLRAEYERLGANVQILDTKDLRAALHPRDLRAALRRLAGQADLRSAELVIANTLSAYWGVHLALLAGRPSLFYIHESTTPANFYLGQLAPTVLPVIEGTFALATHVSFLTEATRRYYRPLLTRCNHTINPGWIDLGQTDRFLAANPRPGLRRRLALDESTRLVVNVGSVCNRKGQHIFARAVDLLWRQQPDLASGALFLMVGGRDTLFDRTMAELLAVLDRPNLRIIAETDKPLAYYGAADLFVCSSYEESFPRVILEAMACGVPILSTDVHGIPEQVTADREALLVPAGDTSALCSGLMKLLRQPVWATSLAAKARARVTDHFDSLKVLPRHLALAAAVTAQSAKTTAAGFQQMWSG